LYATKPDIDGIYKSKDGGNSWRCIGLKGHSIYGITIDPEDRKIVYVCTSENLSNPSPKGVLYRNDEGGDEEWKKIDVVPNGPDPGFTVLAIDPESPGTLYAGTWGEGIYKSTDYGISWRKISPDAYIFPKGITIDQSRPNIIYALTTNGVFRSRDWGNEWTPINKGLPEPPIFWAPTIWGAQLIIDPKEPDTLYITTSKGVYKKDKDSDEWQKIWEVEAEPLIPPHWFRCIVCLGIDPENTNNIYAGSWGGFFRSENSGEFWVQSSKGIQDIYTHYITPDPHKEGGIYVGTCELRAYKTEDFGNSWKQLYDGLIMDSEEDYLECFDVHIIALDPSTHTTLYAGAGLTYFNDRNNCTVKKSIDYGESWSSVEEGLPRGEIKALAIDPTNPSILYTAPHYNGIYKSINSGRSWDYNGLLFHRVKAIAIDPKDPDRVYAGVDKGPLTHIGLFRSTTGGGDWELILKNKSIRDVVIDPRDNSIVYAGGKSGFYKSIDGGNSWLKELAIEGPYVMKIAVDPRISDVVYAQVGRKGIFRSIDGGRTWEELNSGLIHNTNPITTGALAPDPNIPNIIYSGSWGHGVYMCEVTPGPINHYKVYAPKRATQGLPFKLEVIASDSDSWIVTDHKGRAEVYAEDSLIATVEGFLNGMASAEIVLDRQGTVTITVRDSENHAIFGTATIYVEERETGICGRVTDAVTGMPIPRAIVVAFGKKLDYCFTDRDGRYSISDLRPGLYWVIAFKWGYRLQFKRVDVLEGEMEVVDFSLRKRGRAEAGFSEILSAVSERDGTALSGPPRFSDLIVSALIWNLSEEETVPTAKGPITLSISPILDDMDIELLVSMKGSGIIGADLEIGFDPQILELVYIEPEEDRIKVYTETSNGTVRVMAAATEGELDGVVCKIDFRALSGAQSASFKITRADLRDFAGESVEVNLTNAEIELSPKKSALFQSFPNPTSEGCWIPYQLSEAAEVRLTIYNILGQKVREIELGQKPAGFYLTSDSAIFWDAKNNKGELVASGLYFYKLTAGRFSAIKSLMIRR
jgi:photosystem II stability/assembly factor-like uncharacterized protein